MTERWLHRSPIVLASALVLAVSGAVPLAFASDLAGAIQTTTDHASDTSTTVVEEVAEDVAEVVDSVEEKAAETTETVEETTSAVVEDVAAAVEPEPSPSPTPSSDPMEPGEVDGDDQEPADKEPANEGPARSAPTERILPGQEEREERRRPVFDEVRDALGERPEFDATYPRGAVPVDYGAGSRMSGVPQIDLSAPHHSGPRSTVPILDLLATGATPPEVVARILAPFPVNGPATYTDDWGAPRDGGRVHEGVDIFADRGTPVIASVDGTVSHVRTGTAIGGNSLRITASDGTFYYYAHLDGVASGIADGTRVRAGQTVGFVGDSGNAAGTPPHLHFQIHPGGGAPVPPVPYLDRWLEEANRTAEMLSRTTAAPVAAPPVEVASGRGAETPTQTTVPAPRATPPQQSGVAGAVDQTPPLLVALLLAFAVAWFVLRRSGRTVVQQFAGVEVVTADPSAPVQTERRPHAHV